MRFAQKQRQPIEKAEVRVEEFPQTSGNLTAAGQTLYELVTSKRLVMYPDSALRGHALNALAIESARGWRAGEGEFEQED